MKKNKTARINLRVHPELIQRADELAKKTSSSRNQVIEDAVWHYVLDLPNFVRCQTCQDPIFNLQTIPISEGTGIVECHRGHKAIFDFEKEDWYQ